MVADMQTCVQWLGEDVGAAVPLLRRVHLDPLEIAPKFVVCIQDSDTAGVQKRHEVTFVCWTHL